MNDKPDGFGTQIDFNETPTKIQHGVWENGKHTEWFEKTHQLKTISEMASGKPFYFDDKVEILQKHFNLIDKEMPQIL